jgi:DNA-binding winged helix-turn-helix (wHTH) protein
VRHRFGDFTLDEGTREVRRKGADVHLPQKAFDLLRLLVVNRSRAMSKAELLQALWPNTYVEETNLAGLVAQLRRVLGDSADEPRLIRTVYGFGYRFIGEVDADGGATRPVSRPFSLAVLGRHLPLLDGENTIGRSPEATIQIDAPGISRRHARITVSRGQAALEDLASKNGTCVNGQPITGPTGLTHGDRIQFGAIEAVFTTGADTGATETLPVEDGPPGHRPAPNTRRG